VGAYKFDGIDDQAISDGVLGITNYPFSVGVVFMADVSTAAGILAGLIDKDNNTLYQELQYLAADDVALRANAGGGGVSATSLGAGADDVWQTGVGVGTSATSRAAFRAGGNKGTNATSRAWSAAFDRVMVGRFAPIAGPGEPFNGWIAYVFFWDIALSDAEVASFHGGTLVQQAAIKHGYDFTTNQGTTIADLFGARPLTVTGAVYDGAVTPSPSFTLGGASAVVKDMIGPGMIPSAR
jgi:hypothetical protein